MDASLECSLAAIACVTIGKATNPQTFRPNAQAAAQTSTASTNCDSSASYSSCTQWHHNCASGRCEDLKLEMHMRHQLKDQFMQGVSRGPVVTCCCERLCLEVMAEDLSFR